MLPRGTRMCEAAEGDEVSNAARTQQPRENDITELRPFRVEISGAAIDDLRERLGRTRWPEKEPVGDWSMGIPLAYRGRPIHFERDASAGDVAPAGMRTRKCGLMNAQPHSRGEGNPQRRDSVIRSRRSWWRATMANRRLTCVPSWYGMKAFPPVSCNYSQALRWHGAWCRANCASPRRTTPEADRRVCQEARWLSAVA